MASTLHGRGGQVGKRSVAVVATTAVLALVGCAPGSNEVTPTTQPSGGVSTELTTEEVTLTIADETGFPLTDELTAEFTKQHPNITFKVTRDTFANITVGAPRLLASDTPPDLIRLPVIGETVKDGLLANLDPYFDAYGWDTWSEAQLAPLRVNDENVRGSGSLYQLGLGYQVTGIYMNKAIAAELGIDAPPATIAELSEDLATAKAAGKIPLMADIGFVLQGLINQFEDKQAISDWIFTVPGATLDTPGALEAVELFAEWADAGYFPDDILALDYFALVSRFQEGEGLFTFNGNWAAGDYYDKMGDNVEYFLVPPVEEGGGHVAMGAANSFSVAAKSKHIDEIVYFLNWVHTDPAARQIVVDNTGSSPGGDPSLELPSAPNPLIKQALEMSAQISDEDGQVDFLGNATAGIVAGAILPEAQLLVSGKTTPQDFLTKVQNFYEQELAG